MRKSLFLIVGLLVVPVITGVIYAASGDLNVNGQLSVGEGGVKFPDGSVQTTAKRLDWDYTVTGSPVTSVTSPALDGTAAGGYEFEFIIYNPSGGSSIYNLYYNNDQDNNNYRTCRFGAPWGNTAHIYSGCAGGGLGSGREVRIEGTIDVSPRGYVNYMGFGVEDADCHTYWAQRKIESISNLTRLDVVASVTNGIGIGSRFRIWRRM